MMNGWNRWVGVGRGPINLPDGQGEDERELLAEEMEGEGEEGVRLLKLFVADRSVG